MLRECSVSLVLDIHGFRTQPHRSAAPFSYRQTGREIEVNPVLRECSVSLVVGRHGFSTRPRRNTALCFAPPGGAENLGGSRVA